MAGLKNRTPTTRALAVLPPGGLSIITEQLTRLAATGKPTLGLSLVIGLLFGIFPELDLKLAALFYDPTSASFPLKRSGLAAFVRDGAMWIAWALALPALFAIVGKLLRPAKQQSVPETHGFDHFA